MDFLKEKKMKKIKITNNLLRKLMPQRKGAMLGLMMMKMMILSGCLKTTEVIDVDCQWLNPYPKQTAKQMISIHKIDPRVSSWARDYIIEYKANCIT
jgi:hypothetical protein